MKRRAFLAGGMALLGAEPLRAQSAKPPVIGYLGSETETLFERRLRAFHSGLASAGFEETRNLAIEYRWAEGRNDRLPSLAAELVRREVSVIAAPGSVVSALAAKAATSSIPVVFEIGADPVAAGLVASLSRPGGNVTGVTSLNTEVGAKRLELLHEILPAARVFALLVNPANPKNAEATTRDFSALARARGLEARIVEAQTDGDFDAVFTELGRQQVRGLVIANDPLFGTRSGPLAALSLRHKMPTVHQGRDFALAGGLMGYGGSVAESHGQAGLYVGRVLKGERPADLPVYQVTKFELSINLKAANALGIEVPGTLLARADEVIE